MIAEIFKKLKNHIVMVNFRDFKVSEDLETIEKGLNIEIENVKRIASEILDYGILNPLFVYTDVEFTDILLDNQKINYDNKLIISKVAASISNSMSEDKMDLKKDEYLILDGMKRYTACEYLLRTRQIDDIYLPILKIDKNLKIEDRNKALHYCSKIINEFDDWYSNKTLSKENLERRNKIMLYIKNSYEEKYGVLQDS